MHKPIDEKIVPIQTATESGDCNCSCSKTTEKKTEEPTPKNDLAVDLGKTFIDMNG